MDFEQIIEQRHSVRAYTKKDIDEALSISRNISYVNGILNNKVSQIDDEDQGGSKLGYDWFNK